MTALLFLLKSSKYSLVFAAVHCFQRYNFWSKKNTKKKAADWLPEKLFEEGRQWGSDAELGEHLLHFAALAARQQQAEQVEGVDAARQLRR